MKKETGYYREMEELHRIREELQRTPPQVLNERGKKIRARLKNLYKAR